MPPIAKQGRGTLQRMLQMETVAAPEIESLERPIAPFSFFCVSDAAVTGTLRLTAVDMVKAVRTEIRSLVYLLLACPSVETFRAERAKVFGKYSAFARALSKLTMDIDPLVHQQLIQGALATQEHLLHKRGAELLSSEAAGEARFSIVTMQRAFKLIPQILARPAVREEDDNRFAKQFALSVLWASLHLDVLIAALKQGKILPLDVLSEVLQGLRFSVTAYAYAREGYRLRYPSPEPMMFPAAQWDEEDRGLAGQSTAERETTIPDDL